MARKIFVSYKYGDSKVQALPTLVGLLGVTTARHYVDLLQAHLDVNDHINKGENDGEDLGGFKDATIASRLRDKIYDSSITVVLISKGMKDQFVAEADQWIPWEISYSLKEHAREGRTSATNAVLAVVLPDEYGSYEYLIRENTCVACGTNTLMTDSLFGIIRQNMFNRKLPKRTICTHHLPGNQPHAGGDHSYIHSVRWADFLANINWHLGAAVNLNDHVDEFNLVKTV